MDDKELQALITERDAFRAVLEGAGYNNLDALAGMSADTCRMIGEDAKSATAKVTDQRDELLNALNDLLNRFNSSELTMETLENAKSAIARASE